MFLIFQSGNKLLNNCLDCLYEKYKSLGPSYRPPSGRSIRQDLGLYIFPYRQSNQLLRRYCRPSFQLFTNSPSRWTNSAVHQTMLRLLLDGKLKITIDFITIVWEQYGNEDVKHCFLQHLQSTPEIKFECQYDKQLSNILELYSKYLKFLARVFQETFTVTKLS